MVRQPTPSGFPEAITQEGQAPTTPGGDVNGAGPPDRAQPLGLSTLQGRARAQTPCLAADAKDPEERRSARGSHGGDNQAGDNHR